jgi:hypothetical protein
MFWTFKLSFSVDILTFFNLATFWAIFEKFGKFFYLSSGHPDCFSRRFVFPTLEPVVEKATADKSGKKSSTTTASVTADAEATVEKETESVLTAVIAETSETVVIEGVQDDEVPISQNSLFRRCCRRHKIS